MDRQPNSNMLHSFNDVLQNLKHFCSSAYRKHPTWTLACLLMVFPVALGTPGKSFSSSLQLVCEYFCGKGFQTCLFFFPPESVAGKLIFYQMEGNAIYVRNTRELASGVPTETMFELFDPLKNLSSAEFTYTWDLGNGQACWFQESSFFPLYFKHLFSLMQRSDPWDRTSCPLSLLRIRELHHAAELWSDCEQSCTSHHWSLLHGSSSPRLVL